MSREKMDNLNRTIKFRVWVGKAFNSPELANQMHYNPFKKELVYFSGGGELKTYGFAETKLMQFTGLKDKNGVEIYEGDIMQFIDATQSKKIPSEAHYIGWSDLDALFAVYFKDGVYAQKLGTVHHQGEVIGDIYQNLELLE